MLLQHAVRYHKAHNWIWQQDQQQLSLLSHCQLCESQCEQFKKAKDKGQADLTSCKAATTSSSSIHQDTLTTHPRCPKCGYSYSQTNAQPIIKSATIAAACTTMQPCAENPRDLITQSMMPEPDLPGTAELNHLNISGSIPIPILTNAPDPAAGTGRATPPAETDTPSIVPAEAL